MGEGCFPFGGAEGEARTLLGVWDVLLPRVVAPEGLQISYVWLCCEGWPTRPSASQPLRASQEICPNLDNSSAAASSSSSAAAVPSALHLPRLVGSQSH